MSRSNSEASDARMTTTIQIEIGVWGKFKELVTINRTTTREEIQKLIKKRLLEAEKRGEIS